jgi:hypothetical protein
MLQIVITNIRSAEQQIGFIKANIETINAVHYELLSSILYGKENHAIFDKSDKQVSSALEGFLNHFPPFRQQDF